VEDRFTPVHTTGASESLPDTWHGVKVTFLFVFLCVSGEMSTLRQMMKEQTWFEPKQSQLGADMSQKQNLLTCNLY